MKKLTEEQTKRLNEIREQMSALDKEAREIVEPTPEEIQNAIDCYADDGSYDLAELMMDSWGMWEDILNDRSIAEEEADNA